MKYILMILTAVSLSGCLMSADPLREAQAKEKVDAATISLNQSNAQIEAAHQAQMETALERERSRQLQSEQAILASQQVIAQAQANVAIANTIAQAAKPDYTPLILVMLILMTTVVGFGLWFSGTKRGPLPAVSYAALPEPARRLQIPLAVQQRADNVGGVAQWDGERWLIIDPTDGRVLARQRMLTG